jgi:hypothetical protein
MGHLAHSENGLGGHRAQERSLGGQTAPESGARSSPVRFEGRPESGRPIENNEVGVCMFCGRFSPEQAGPTAYGGAAACGCRRICR